jgi:small multidrug resistance pump
MTATMPYVLLVLAIVSEIVATSALKASDGMTRLVPSLVVVVGYALAFFLLSHTLKSMPVGFVYAVWSGVGIVGVAILGVWFFGESMTPAKLAGMALIVLGVGLLETTSGS